MQTLISRRRTVLEEVLRSQGRRHGWVARQVGISDAMFSRMLKGERHCTAEQADIIASLVAVPVAEFYRDREFVIATQTSDTRMEVNQ